MTSRVTPAMTETRTVLDALRTRRPEIRNFKYDRHAD